MNYNLANLDNIISTYVKRKPGLLLNRLIFLGFYPNGKSYFAAILINISEESDDNNTVEIIEKGRNNEVRTLISNSGLTKPLCFYVNGQPLDCYVEIDDGALVKLVPEGKPEFTDVFIGSALISHHKEIDAKGVVTYLPGVDSCYKELLKTAGFFEQGYFKIDSSEKGYKDDTLLSENLLLSSKMSNLIIGGKVNEDLGKELSLETGVPFLSMDNNYDLYDIRKYTGVSLLSTYCQNKIKGVR